MAKKPKTSRTFNKLTRLQVIQLHNWINDHPLPSKTLASNKLAEMASSELGFPITQSSVSGLRKEMGIEVERPTVTRRKVTFEVIRTLARELVDLRRKLNEPVSKELEDLGK